MPKDYEVFQPLTNLRPETIAAVQGRPALTNDYQRMWDLVRQMRSELLDARLITREEYGLLAGAETDGKPGQGSPSPRRLESYDALREQLSQVEKERDSLKSLRECDRQDVETMDALHEDFPTIRDGARTLTELKAKLSSLSEKLEGLLFRMSLMSDPVSRKWSIELEALLGEEPLRTLKQEKDKT